MKKWDLFIEDIPLSASENMRKDLDIFNSYEKGEKEYPSLRIYSWKNKAISLGYSQKTEEEIDIQKASAHGLEIVKRPTGGGIVFHDVGEITYSIFAKLDDPVFPRGLISSYKKISSALVSALNVVGIPVVISEKRHVFKKGENYQLCFSYPSEYEILYDGKKIVGSAQKRGRRAFMQQGSIFSDFNHGYMEILKKPFSNYLAVSPQDIIGKPLFFKEFSIVLKKAFEKEFEIKFSD